VDPVAQPLLADLDPHGEVDAPEGSPSARRQGPPELRVVTAETADRVVGGRIGGERTQQQLGDQETDDETRQDRERTNEPAPEPPARPVWRRVAGAAAAFGRFRPLQLVWPIHRHLHPRARPHRPYSQDAGQARSI
jgi:hypothetical protein